MELIPRVDFLVKSEGELALPRLVDAIRSNDLTDEGLRAIPNLTWRNVAGEYVENPIELPKESFRCSPSWRRVCVGNMKLSGRVSARYIRNPASRGKRH